jgi:hypothetical protein
MVSGTDTSFFEAALSIPLASLTLVVKLLVALTYAERPLGLGYLRALLGPAFLAETRCRWRPRIYCC